jgi:predicted NAD/FAD-dependent oxidoreductase
MLEPNEKETEADMARVAIIGAGLSALVLAAQLQRRARVTLFEKSHGVGGRLATRYASPYEFDHGAQYFTACTGEFRDFLAPLIAKGVVAPWQATHAEIDGNRVISEQQWGADSPRYVGSPRMNAIGKHLAADLDIRLDTPVKRSDRNGDFWQISGDDEIQLGEFDWVVSTAPPIQSAALLPTDFTELDDLSNARMSACFALMLGFEEALPLPWQAASIENAAISFIAVNSSKPGRPDGFTLVVHSSSDWSETHLDDEPQSITDHLLHELGETIGHEIEFPDHCRLQRWRYAKVATPAMDEALIDSDNRLAACGDWCLEGRVESAWSSAMALSRKLLPLL